MCFFLGSKRELLRIQTIPRKRDIEKEETPGRDIKKAIGIVTKEQKMITMHVTDIIETTTDTTIDSTTDSTDTGTIENGTEGTKGAITEITETEIETEKTDFRGITIEGGIGVGVGNTTIKIEETTGKYNNFFLTIRI